MPVCPCACSYAGPALFLDALWLPYRRDPAALEAALAAASDGAAPLRAVFAHADIVSRAVKKQLHLCEPAHASSPSTGPLSDTVLLCCCLDRPTAPWLVVSLVSLRKCSARGRHDERSVPGARRPAARAVPAQHPHIHGWAAAGGLAGAQAPAWSCCVGRRAGIASRAACAQPVSVL